MKSRIPIPYLKVLCLIISGWAQTLMGQSPVTAISASYQSQSSLINLYIALPVGLGAFGSCTSTSYTYTFSNGAANQYKLNSFNTKGSTYLVAPSSPAVVRLRRVDNANVTGTRNIVYMETTAASAVACPTSLSFNFKPPYIDSMEALLGAGMLNQGTDNIFTNAANGDGNNNNIERVDVIFQSGLNTTSPSQAGFAIFDRGNNYQHDPFKIVAITSLDGQGNPNGFGAVKTCTGGNGSNNNGNWGHPADAAGNKQFACYVLRKDASDAKLRASSNVNQEIGGVFYSFADLGIAAGQSLYGYALLGPDGIANPGTAQLLDLNNTAVYPTTTTEAAGGGLDLVAVNTVFATGSYVVLPLSVTAFNGSQQDGQASFQWEIAGVAGNETVALQRSADGVSFHTIYTTAAVMAGSYKDGNMPEADPCYYRLRVTTGAGQDLYSRTVALHPDHPVNAASWQVFPTVVAQGQTLKIQGLTDGYYILSLYDVSGACRKTDARVINGQSVVALSSGNLPAGIYWLSLSAGGKKLPGNGKIFVR